MTTLPRGPVIDALAAELAAIADLLDDLPDAAWATPTDLPGWDVHANVAHIIGTEAMLLGQAPPDHDVDIAALPHVRNDIAAMNEAWIAGLADDAPAVMRARLRAVTTDRLAVLRAVTDDEWDAVGFTPAGPDTHGRFMRIRTFDCWMHEQDIRDAVGRPGHTSGPEVDLALDEVETALGFVVGKRAGFPDGASATFVLDDGTGGGDGDPTEGGRTVHVRVDGRAGVVDALDDPATVTLRTSVHTFSRVAGGRRPADAFDDITVEGDPDLGARLLAHLAYTI